MLFNASFWIAFWCIFAFQSHPCVKGADIDECVILGRTFSGDELPWTETLVMLPMVVQIPSILIAESIVRPSFRLLGLSPISRLAGTSEGGFVLVLSTIISMLQWAAIGWLIARFWRSRPQGVREQSA
jgi:hypothetical protein